MVWFRGKRGGEGQGKGMVGVREVGVVGVRGG